MTEREGMWEGGSGAGGQAGGQAGGLEGGGRAGMKGGRLEIRSLCSVWDRGGCHDNCRCADSVTT